jgi:streptogramin lyase
MRFDGKVWETPPPLGFAVDDVVATRSGQVWMATDRGIAVWDGSRLRRVDTRRGLAEDRTLDLAVDQFDRVWARGPGSLALITQ